MLAAASLLPDAASAPRVLVADDDPASRRFLGDGLRQLGADVTTCEDGTSALALARRFRFDLLLLDCRMPGAGALAVLEAVRADLGAASRRSPAVATSAEVDADERRRLLAAGFGDILLKPCDLHSLARIWVLGRDRPPLLDDPAALASTGDTRTMRALRQLLREELLGLDRELDRLGTDHAVLTERLHRLRSSCGFCGAAALGEATVSLQRQLAEAAPDAPLPLAAFRDTLQATLQALAHEPS